MKKNISNKGSQGITVSELSWRPNNQDKFILNNINSVLEKGNFYGIIGPNGSGKTSFIKNLLRFIDSNTGTIELDTLNIHKYKRQEFAKKIAIVPQNTNLDSSFLVFDIVLMGRVPYQKRFAEISEEDKAIVTEAMKLTDCYSLREKEFSTLSGGEAQRVITARAIAQDTEWLILDEPTSNLDVKHQIELMNSMVMLNITKKKTILAVLHDINLASAYCNQIIMMKDGKIHSQGKTEDVLTKDNLVDVYGIHFDILSNSHNGKNYFVPYN